jgi:carbon monoxide dehydrogenase subunit G
VTLLDMEQVGPCFPGAILDHVDGDEFSGSVKIKLGPIRMTYKGTAKIVEKDEVRHRARIEATGNAGGSTSTAAMMVTATATELAPNRTAVDLVTTLSLTGRPAQFGRGVMVDVGNKLIGQFADCVSNKLAGRTSGGAELIDVVNPDEVAADYVARTESHRERPGRAEPAVRHRDPDSEAGGADRVGHHCALLGAQALQEASGRRGRGRRVDHAPSAARSAIAPRMKSMDCAGGSAISVSSSKSRAYRSTSASASMKKMRVLFSR